MNVKKAKALRKQLGYKPSAERVYDQKVAMKPALFEENGQLVSHKIPKVSYFNHEKSPRAKYLAAKKVANG